MFKKQIQMINEDWIDVLLVGVYTIDPICSILSYCRTYSYESKYIKENILKIHFQNSVFEDSQSFFIHLNKSVPLSIFFLSWIINLNVIHINDGSINNKIYIKISLPKCFLYIQQVLTISSDYLFHQFINF